MKPNILRLELETYPFRIDISLRFADIDPQWHLNNVRVGEYYQEGRVSFFRHLHQKYGYERVAGSRFLVAHQSIDYLEEVTYPGNITIGVGVARVGKSSWSFALGMFASERCVGVSTTVIVYANEKESTPIPDTYRALLEQHLLPADSLT